MEKFSTAKEAFIIGVRGIKFVLYWTVFTYNIQRVLLLIQAQRLMAYILLTMKRVCGVPF